MNTSARKMLFAVTAESGRWRTSLALLLVVLALFSALAVGSYRVIDRELTQAALAGRSSDAYLAASVLNEKFERLTDLGVSLASRVRFRELVQAKEWSAAIEILKRVPEDFPMIARLTLHSIDGTLMADSPPDPAVMGRRFNDRDWYRGVSREWRPYISEVYQRAAAPRFNVVVAAVPIPGAAGQPAGILVLQVRGDLFFEWTRAIEAGPGGVVYVVDQRGRVAAHPKFQSQGALLDYSNMPVVKRLLQGGRGVDIEPASKDFGERVVAYEPLVRFGWGVVLEQPADAAFAVRDSQLRRVQIAFAVMLALIAALFFLAFRTLADRRHASAERLAKQQLEQSVAHRTAQLEASNKELASFNYSISHDLRAPLRAIDAFTHLLAESCGAALGDEGRRKLAVIRDNGRRMSRLVDDLLEFSRLARESAEPARVDMGGLAAEVCEEMRGAYPHASFNRPTLPEAWGNAKMLRQVWQNLIGNAFKFSAQRSDASLEVGGYRTEAECVYFVKDNGAGFDMRYADKLFGVFQRLHAADEFPGTGVGLAIVQRIVERHRGRVWAEGEVGAGATFYFALPRSGPG